MNAASNYLLPPGFIALPAGTAMAPAIVPAALAPLGELPSAPPRRVLIIKPSSLGDVVSALPVLRGLRRSFPDCRVDWLISTGCAPLLQGDGDLDQLVLFDRPLLGRWWRSRAGAKALVSLSQQIRRRGYDWVIDLQGLLRSGLFGWLSGAGVRAGFAHPRERLTRAFYTHAIDVGAAHTIDRNIELARRLGIDARGEDFRLNVTPAARDRAIQLLRQGQLEQGRFLVLVPPTRWPSKLYPARHWRALVGHLAGQYRMAIVGAPSERDICAAVAQGLESAAVNLAGRTGLAELAALISLSAGVVCSDSAAMFIAPAVGVPALALVGPTRVELTGPYNLGGAVVSSAPCRGCLSRRCRHTACMQLIDPSDVAVAARTLLERTSPP